MKFAPQRGSWTSSLDECHLTFQIALPSKVSPCSLVCHAMLPKEAANHHSVIPRLLCCQSHALKLRVLAPRGRGGATVCGMACHTQHALCARDGELPLIRCGPLGSVLLPNSTPSIIHQQPKKIASQMTHTHKLIRAGRGRDNGRVRSCSTSAS